MSEKTLTLTQAAKQLGIGRNRLLAELRDAGWLNEEPRMMRNAPTKDVIDKGWLKPKMTQFYRGPVRVQYITAMVTAQGLVCMRDLLQDLIESLASAS